GAAQRYRDEFHVKRWASGAKERQTAMDKSVTSPGERPSPQQRAGAIVSLIQQAQAACRADLDSISDPRARELFVKVADYLAVAPTAVQNAQQEDPPQPRRPLH